MIQTLPLPYPKPLLTLNQRLHWAREYRLKKQLRRETALLARHHKIRAVDTAEITLHWRPAVKRNRDGDNPVATLKPCVDGLVDAGILPADTHDIVKHAVVIHAPIKGKSGATWLTIDDGWMP